MDFGALPPEVNSARMYAGAGAAPLLGAAVAWDALAEELQAAASAYASVISDLTSGPWLGAAAMAAAAAAMPYAMWMSATGAQALDAAGQAKAAVAAYETAYAMTVPPAVVAANRAQLAALVATNVLGQNTAAIAATEAQYAQMWAQDAAAMYGYAASSAAAATLTPFEAPPQVTSAAAPAAPSTAIAQVTGQAGSAQSTLGSLMTSLPTALQGMASPVSATDLSLGELSGDLSNLSMIGETPIDVLSSFLGMTQGADDVTGAAASEAAGAAEAAIGATQATSAVTGGAAAIGEGAVGAMGQAQSLGSLSVPPTWAAATTATHPLGNVSSTLPEAISTDNTAPLAPSMMGGMPRGAGTESRGTLPRYGFVPTIMAQPHSVGYRAAV
ncbi:MAG: hypothetical protein CK431_07530 [Mycobacterium sp.]|nr:MAG: hypothetical protein CK431_07530 [Mycobacterium sp.]